MGIEVSERIHILFFPFMAHGHMIPMLDMAKLFSTRGARSTILTTPINSKILEKPIEVFKTQNPDLEIGIKILNFPCVELGLPEGCENVDFINSYQKPDPSGNLFLKFLFSTKSMKQDLESFIETTKPSCIVADMFFPWTTESAEKFNVPRLVFHGTCFFSLCCSYNMRTHKPHKKVATSSTPFVIPGLPGDDIVITEEQANIADEETPMGKIKKEVSESESNSFGVLVNSFYELEPDYADYYRSFVAKRAWHIGPLSLCNRDLAEKAGRGKKANIDEQECFEWLESKPTGSVVYVSFGSVASLTNEQLQEIAIGLEGSGKNFIWVVKKNENQGENEDWLPEGYEERTKGKGLIIRGWAPQVLILDHKAIGGFVTHCGWNSAIEGIVAGLPMVTWPMGAEQFYNEKLLTKVLETGVNVGATELMKKGQLISREEVEKAVKEVLVGEEAEKRRLRAKKLGEMAKAAVEVGGSSYNDLNRFMEDISCRK